MNIGGTSTHRQLGELAFQARLQRHLDDVAVGQSARSAAVATEVKERDAEAQDFLSHTAPDALTRYLVLTGHMSYGERAMAATAISRRAREVQAYRTQMPARDKEDAHGRGTDSLA